MVKDSKLTAAMLEMTSDYAGRLEDERKMLVDKLNHAESVIHELTGDKELLKSERDALAAKIGMIKQWHEDCGRWPDTTQEMEKIDLILNKSPSQCLAEIKAEAGMAGFVAGYMSTVHFDDDGSESLWAEGEAKLYADKVRHGGE